MARDDDTAVVAPDGNELITDRLGKEQTEMESETVLDGNNGRISLNEDGEEFIDWERPLPKPLGNHQFSDEEIFYNPTQSSSSVPFFKKEENPSDEKSKNMDKLLLGLGLTAASVGIACSVVGLLYSIPVAILGLALIISAATALMVSGNSELNSGFSGGEYSSLYHPMSMFPMP